MKRGVDIVYGLMFIVSTFIYSYVLNHFVTLSFKLGSFLYIFGISLLILIGTILITNEYISQLPHQYYEYVSLTYVIMGTGVLLYTKTSYLYTSICAVIAIYYLVKQLKHMK